MQHMESRSLIMEYYNIQDDIIADAKQQIIEAKMQFASYRQAYQDMQSDGLDVSFMVKPDDEYYLKLCSRLGIDI